MPAAYGTASAAVNQESGTSVTLSKPASTAQNDVLVAVVKVEQGGAPALTVPSGWTLEEVIGHAEITGYVAWKRAGASEPASYTFSWPTAGWGSGVIYRFTGVATTGNPLDGGLGYAGFGPTLEDVAYTAPAPGLGILAFGSYNDEATLTFPSGYTQRDSQVPGAHKLATRTDAAGSRSTGTGTVGVGDANQRYHYAATLPDAGGAAPASPVASAGPDREVYAGESITLAGSGSQPGGGTVTYSWDAPGFAVEGQGTTTPKLTAPLRVDDTTVVVTLTVRNASGQSTTDTVSVLVRGVSVFYGQERDGTWTTYVFAAPGSTVAPPSIRVAGLSGTGTLSMGTPVVGGSTTAFTPVSGTIRVMPLGDSLTQADNTVLGWKGYLLDQLVAAGEPVDYVGSQTATGPAALKDPHHEGHSGWQNSSFQPVIQGYINTYKPHVVVMHLGTNDIWSNISAAVALQRLRDNLDKIFAAMPTAYVILNQIAQTNVGKDAELNAYNVGVAQAVVDYKAAGKRIQVHNMNAVVTKAYLQGDGIHWVAFGSASTNGHLAAANSLFPVVKGAIDRVQAGQAAA